MYHMSVIILKPCKLLQTATMSASVARVTRQVKPLLSGDVRDARARVLNLYKAWYRHIPFMVKDFDFPKNEDQCREVLRYNVN